jgi:hypothetical protein
VLVEGPSRTYRTRLSLRIAVGLAAAFWAGMALVLVRAPGSPLSAALGAAGFAAFFVASLVVYERWSITVTRDGIVASSPLRRKPVRFDEILEIVVRDGLGGRAYAVVTRRGLVRFTSLFARHAELFEMLLERSDLSPRRA